MSGYDNYGMAQLLMAGSDHRNGDRCICGSDPVQQVQIQENADK